MKRNAGLSYLELLVVLILLSITSVLIGGAFDFLRQARERSIILQSAEESILLRGLLRGWIEEMSPVAGGNGFAGSANGFSFVMNGRLRAIPDASRIEISFNLESTASDLSAMIKISGLNREGALVLEDLRELEFDLSSASVQYYGSITNEVLGWADEWQGNGLPELIKFEATRQNGDPMPPLIMQPSVTFNQSLISAFFPSPPT